MYCRKCLTAKLFVIRPTPAERDNVTAGAGYYRLVGGSEGRPDGRYSAVMVTMHAGSSSHEADTRDFECLAQGDFRADSEGVFTLGPHLPGKVRTLEDSYNRGASTGRTQ